VIRAGKIIEIDGVLLAQHNEVVALDLLAAKVEMLNRGESPIEDDDIRRFLQSGQLNFRATLDPRDAYEGADFVIIATPTDYDPETNFSLFHPLACTTPAPAAAAEKQPRSAVARIRPNQDLSHALEENLRPPRF